MSDGGHYLALSGGVGGAKLALGLSRLLAPDALTIAANVADDFEHLGLHISPDLDSNMYALAGLANEDLGWGRAGESWRFMAALKELGGDDWFNLGDQDLAVHVERTRRLRAGESLSQVTEGLCRALGSPARLAPVSDQPIRTIVETGDGELTFQHYFVRERCVPAVTGFRFDGIEAARLSPVLEAALARPDLNAVIICPSNPFVSVDPVLGIPGLRQRLRALAAPVIAVSPIVGGQAIKGPAAKMMRELALPATPVAVAAHYGDLLDGFVIDETDRALAGEFPGPPPALLVTATVMRDLDDRIALARAVVDFAGALVSDRASP